MLAGFLNALAYVWFSSSEALVGDDAGDWPWMHVAIFVSLASFAGLLVAEILLRAMGPALRKALWSRSLALMLGFGFGGMLTAASLVIVAAISSVIDPNVDVGFVGTAAFILVAMVLGGFVGVTEGLLLAVPLAALLGLSIR